MERRTAKARTHAQASRWPLLGIVTLCCCAIVAAAHAQPASAPASPRAVIYPARDQSPKQQDMDKYACHDWARGQSGFDPTQHAGSSQATAPGSSPQPGATMASGALGGAAIGELASGDAGRGAAAGALGAAALERARQRQAAQAKQQRASQQQAAQAEQRALYDRAFAACMESRGYTLK